MVQSVLNALAEDHFFSFGSLFDGVGRLEFGDGSVRKVLQGVTNEFLTVMQVGAYNEDWRELGVALTSEPSLAIFNFVDSHAADPRFRDRTQAATHVAASPEPGGWPGGQKPKSAGAVARRLHWRAGAVPGGRSAAGGSRRADTDCGQSEGGVESVKRPRQPISRTARTRRCVRAEHLLVWLARPRPQKMPTNVTTAIADSVAMRTALERAARRRSGSRSRSCRSNTKAFGICRLELEVGATQPPFGTRGHDGSGKRERHIFRLVIAGAHRYDDVLLASEKIGHRSGRGA